MLQCIQEAEKWNQLKIKINNVVIRGVNDEECGDFVDYFKDKRLSLRFIEYMPFDGMNGLILDNQWKENKMVPYQELIKTIEKRVGPLEKISDDPNDTSKNYTIPGHIGQVGFITSMTDHFCGGNDSN